MRVDEVKGLKGIEFIDPFFAVVLSISFTTIITEPWFDDFSLAKTEPNLFHIFVLGLGYMTVLLSWFFYHMGLEKSPETRFWRFICDVGMLSAYFLLLVKFENLTVVLTILAVVYLWFFLWDQFRRTEYPTTDNPKRRGVTVFWLTIFWLLAAAGWLFGERGLVQDPGHVEWLLLSIAAVATVAYRFHKKSPWPEPLLCVLGQINLPLRPNSLEPDAGV